MHTHLKVFGAVLLVLFAFSCLFTLPSVVGQTSQADSKLQVANSAVNQAFSDVLAAEKDGANVTSLVNQLNGAADLLVQAEMNYRNGDFATAANNADGAVLVAQQVSSLAQNEQVVAQALARSTFSYAVAFSVGASVYFVFLLVIVWSRVKRNYTKNLSDAKPELAQPEA
jgi:hypothetical protein